MNLFRATFRTPEGTAFDDDVASLVLPGPRGFFGVLAHHAPMVAALVPGVVVAAGGDGACRYFVIGDGVVEIAANRAMVLAESVLSERSQGEAEDRLERFLKGRWTWAIRPVVVGPGGRGES